MRPLPDAADDEHPPFREVYCHTVVQSSGSAFTGPRPVLSDDRVSSPSVPTPLLSSIADRLKHALEKEGRSQNSLEKEVGFSVNRYATGKRGASYVDVDKMRVIANALHVRVEWLVWNDGSMRRDGRDPTPAEEAMVLARKSGVREEVWRAAWERYKDREAGMTALDWAMAIHTESELWGRELGQRDERLGPSLPPARVDGRQRGKTTRGSRADKRAT